MSWAKNCSIFPFLLYDCLFLFLPCFCNCCLIFVRRGLLSQLRGDTEVCRDQIAALEDVFFAKAVLKNPAFWKYTALCKCSPLPMFFHCLHLFLISFLLPWGNVSAVMFLTADDFWEQLSRFGVQNGYISVTVWVYEYIYNMFINMFAKHLREGRSLSC